MIERKFIELKKNEFAIKEFVKSELGKGKISSIRIERTPIGEKISVRTSKPGLIIGRRGEKISDLTETLKKQFKLENPHIEIIEIKNPDLDAQNIADEIALALERGGQLSFKVVAYKMLERIKKAGALGAEIRLSGKLPSERARSWRFTLTGGYLKKVGDTARVVDRAETAAKTIPGIIGIKVEILPPDAEIEDKIEITKEMLTEKIEKEKKQEREDEKTKEEKKKSLKVKASKNKKPK
jgi:small subunit ribosomal protein S3